MTLTVIVDDADPVIQYAGNGPILDPRTLDTSYNGTNQSIGGTLHNTSIPAFSSFSYNFSGAGTVAMFALLNPGAAQRESQDDLWVCQINGVATVPLKLEPFQVTATQEICSGNGAPDTENQFQFNLAIPISGVDILFDYLQYIPSPSAVAQSYRFISVSYDDSSVEYEGTWSNESGDTESDGKLAGKNGSSLGYSFNGSSITVVSDSISLPQVVQTANILISIDSQQPTMFTIEPGEDGTEFSFPNRILFQSSTLDSSIPHTINVTYFTAINATSTSNLLIHSLIIGDATIPASQSVPNGNSTANSTVATPTTPSQGLPTPTAVLLATHHNHKYAPIVSSVIGGLIFSLVVVFLVLWTRKLKKQKSQHISYTTTTIAPFTTNPMIVINRILGSPIAIASEIKARRRLPLTHRDALMIPPAKSREINITQTDGISDTEGQQDSPVVVVEDTSAEVEQGPVAIHAVDSGLRHVEERRGSEVDILPPLYTPV